MKLLTNNKKITFVLAKGFMLRTNGASVNGPLAFPVSPFSALHIVRFVAFGWSQGRCFLLCSQISLVDDETGRVLYCSCSAASL